MRTAVIEVEGRFVDNITDEAASASKAVDKVGKSADKAEKELNDLGKKKVHPVIDADNSKILKKLRESENKAARLAGKTFTATLKVLDGGTAIVNKVAGGLKNITKKTWTTAVKIKDYATAPLRAIKNSLFSIKTLVMAITAGIAAKQFVLDPISLADAYSNAQIGFSTLLGEKAGKAMMDEIDAFAAATPFKTAGVISNVQKMMAYGWDADRVIDDMKTIGDAAAATGKGDQGLESIVYALSEIRSKGKLSTQELNQLASAGIKAKQYLAQGLGYGTDDTGMAKLMEDLEGGAVGANQAIELILQGMQEFNGMMDKTANETVSGLWGQITDTFEINVIRKWGQGLQDGARKGMGTVVSLLDQASGAMAELGDLAFEVGKNISNWAVDKLKGLVDKITSIAETDVFKSASLGGKFKILWKSLIANPIKEWWDGGGREKTISTAGKIGKWIGEAMKTGILALLGITDLLKDGGINETGAMTVAQSFAKGFVDGFDVSAITDKLVEAISNVWNALPAWAKIALGVYGGAKVASGISRLVGGATSLIGGLGSASQMTGLLGYGTTAAINLGAGNLAGGGSLGAAGLSALGLGATAGGIVGGATVISGGIDLYEGFKNDDTAAKKSGAWKLGGVAAGAGVGAAIGSVIPVVGTGVGALIGAGVGGLVGWIKGDKVKADAAAKQAKEQEKAAKTAADLAEEEARLIRRNKELIATSLDEHFGDIVLSAEELQKVTRDIVGEEFLTGIEAATTAIDSMNSSLSAMEAQSSAFKKNLWMATVKRDAKLTADEVTNLKDSSEALTNTAQSYVKDAQYAATEAITAIMGNSKEAQALIDSTNEYYGKKSDELASLTKQLNDELSAALKDNVISVDERASIEGIRESIANINKEIAADMAEGALNTEIGKFLMSDLSSDSFKSTIENVAKTNKEAEDALWVAYGAASGGKTDEEKKILRQSTYDSIAQMYGNSGMELLGGIKEAYSEALGVLTGDLDTLAGDLGFVGILDAVNSMDESARLAVGDLMKAMEPNTAQIEELIAKYESMGMEVPKALTDYMKSAEFLAAVAEGPQAVEEYLRNTDLDLEFSPNLSPNLPRQLKTTVEDFLASNPIGIGNRVAVNLGIDWHYDKFNDEWISPDGKYTFTTDALVEAGWHYNYFEAKWISPDNSYYFNTDANVNTAYSANKFAGNKASFGIQDSYTFSTSVILNAQTRLGSIMKQAPQAVVKEARGGIIYPQGINAPGFADGGMVRGGPRLITVAEEGSPEMIIPLGSQRRDRALKLWSKAGEMMDVPGFARGGLTNGGNDEGLRFHRYGTDEQSGGQTVQVDVGGVTVEIHVHATEGQTVAEAIREQAQDIAETVAGILDDAYRAQFENTPVRGGAA